jgi:CubicO group peptidase (beta-lactamase class C family)
MKSKIAIILIIILLFSNSLVFAGSIKQTPSGIPFYELEEFIDDYVHKYTGKSTPGASVVLVDNGEIIFSKGYGYADIENEILVDSKNTVFEYGSISKLFVYTTIMRLSESGKIDLNADIRKYLPEGFLRKLKYDKPITMLNIMNHTTGFEDYLFDILLTSPDKLPTMEETLQNSQPEQVYEPGTISAYSNYAVSLAAYIAEQMIGQDFHQYLMDTIFSPLEMNSTSAHPTLADYPELIDNKAKGYYSQGNGDFVLGSWSFAPMYPIGGVNGTAEDLARFAIALMPNAGEISPLFNKKETLDEMFTQSHPMGPGFMGFSHGFIEWDGEYRGLGHGGNTIAFSTQINIVPEKKFGVIVLTNSAGEMDISSGLTEALIGKGDKDEITIGENPLPSESEVEGTYISARRMHNGFLELYGYLSLLEVKALDSNKIQLSTAGQSATLIQTQPYVYERIKANGPIFKYRFNKVYFEMSNGKVQRLSGDFIPIPPERSKPLLIFSLIIAIVGSLYFLITPFVWLIRKILNKRNTLKRHTNYNSMARKHGLLVLAGTGLFLNNGLLILRMLNNNYRSFAEIRIHILLNYPLVTIASILSILLFINLKKSKSTNIQRILYLFTIILTLTYTFNIYNWQFLKLIG